MDFQRAWAPSHAERMDERDETQMYELRCLLKPLAILGKTLPEQTRREMQCAIRNLVEWSLDARSAADEPDENPVDLRFAAPGPGHRQGFSFIYVPPNLQQRVPNRLSTIPDEYGLEIENKAIVYDFRTDDTIQRATAFWDAKPIIETRQPPVLPPSDRTYSDRIKELEEENFALREKIFTLIRTLSIENEKARTRIMNLQCGMGVTSMKTDSTETEHEEYLVDYRTPSYYLEEY